VPPFSARFFPNVLPYTLGSAGSYGFVEIDGRSLIDDAADVVLSLATNSALSDGLDKNVVVLPKTTFPYVS
jgi:hypothetical protein